MTFFYIGFSQCQTGIIIVLGRFGVGINICYKIVVLLTLIISVLFFSSKMISPVGQIVRFIIMMHLPYKPKCHLVVNVWLGLWKRFIV